MAPARAVVVADDKLVTRTLLARLLKLEGFDSVLAKDGEGALELCREHRPRLLLVDRTIPPPLYFEIAETLRVEFGAAAPSIVVMTGKGAISLPEAVDAVLLKPFSREALRAVLKRFANGD